MIKRLKCSLTAKIFIITALLLTMCSIATYCFIVWMIPQIFPYQIDLSQAELLAYEAAQELRQTRIDYYSFRTEALQGAADDHYKGDIELHVFDPNGYEISRYDMTERTGKTISDYSSDMRTQVYSFSFTGDSSTYRLVYADSNQAVKQAIQALGNAFPYLIIAILCISLLSASAYSRYITAPVKKINRAARKMAALDFDIKLKAKRADELGEVSNSLDLLSEKLATALTELAQVNSKLAEDFEREKQLEKQRSELFSSVSHELKTPITIAKGQLQGMISGVGRYKDRETYLVQSLEAVTRLEMMVQELLTVSRMEAPNYSCNLESFDLAMLIKQCLMEQEDLFIRNEMKLISDLPSNLIYAGDAQLLKLAFSNLINNALAYSPPQNTIVISLKESNTGIKLSIENTGVHINESDLPRIFEAFFRTDQSRNRHTGGSGLGLYIVKKVMELHNAEYRIENAAKGVVFTATL